MSDGCHLSTLKMVMQALGKRNFPYRLVKNLPSFNDQKLKSGVLSLNLQGSILGMMGVFGENLRTLGHWGHPSAETS